MIRGLKLITMASVQQKLRTLGYYIDRIKISVKVKICKKRSLNWFRGQYNLCKKI